MHNMVRAKAKQNKNNFSRDWQKGANDMKVKVTRCPKVWGKAPGEWFSRWHSIERGTWFVTKNGAVKLPF